MPDTPRPKATNIVLRDGDVVLEAAEVARLNQLIDRWEHVGVDGVESTLMIANELRDLLLTAGAR